ncbi:unnamed protein product [Lymnaea stagnalis]|uniref:Uncharacterized protein n=1 Tax=Lymnaea stagnalis TaxID=6523 RepID=A0AAV2I0B0_LYMST
MLFIGRVSILELTGVFMLGVGVLLNTAGLATPGLVELATYGGYMSLGLWKYCWREMCAKYKYETVHFHDIQQILIRGQVFAILAMVSSCLGLALTFTSVALRQMGKPKIGFLHVISFVAYKFSLAFILRTLIVCGVMLQPSILEIGYSFILSTIGGIMILVGNIVFYLAIKKVDDTPQHTRLIDQS